MQRKLPHTALSFFFLLLGMAFSGESLAQCESWLPISNNGKWGFIDRQGTIKLPPTFEHVTLFHKEGYAVVTQKYLMGLIDSTGKVVIPCIHNSLVYESPGFVAIGTGKGRFLADVSGTISPQTACVDYLKITNSLVLLKQEGFDQIADLKFNILADTVHEWVIKDNILLHKNRLWYAKGLAGKPLLEAPLDTFIWTRYNNVMLKTEAGWGIANSEKEITPCVYDTFELKTSLIGLFKGDSSVFYSHLLDSCIFPGTYSDVRYMNTPSVFKVNKGAFIGLVHLDGTVILEPIYTNIRRDRNRYVASINSQSGLFELDGTEVLPCLYNFIDAYDNGLLGIAINQRRGIANSSGKVIIPCQYDRFEVELDRIKAYSGSDLKVIEMDGQRVVAEYDYANVLRIQVAGISLQPRSMATNQTATPGWFQPGRGGRYGLRDSTLTVRLAPTYKYIEQVDTMGVTVVYGASDARMTGSSDIYFTVSGSGAVTGNLLYVGVVDHTRYLELFKPRYLQIESADFAGGHKLARYIAKDQTMGFLDKFGSQKVSALTYLGPLNSGMIRANRKGHLYSDRYERTETIEEISDFAVRNFPQFTAVGNMQSRSASKKNNYLMVEGGQWGYFSAGGQLLIPFQYDYAGDMVKNVAVVKADGKFGVINTANEPIISFEFDEILRIKLCADTLFEVRKNQNVCGFIDTIGLQRVGCFYRKVDHYTDGLSLVKLKNGYNFVNPFGEELLAESVSKARPFKDDLAAVRIGRNYGFISTKGKVVIDPEYRAVGDFNDDRAWFSDGRKMGYLDGAGNVVLAAKFRKAGDFYKGFAPIVSRSRTGLMDLSGEIVVKQKYKVLEPVSETEFWAFRKKRTFGLMSNQGKAIIPPKYQEFAHASEGRIAAKRHNLWTFFNEQGDKISDQTFVDVRPFSQGFASVRTENLWGVIDLDGNELIEPRFDEASTFSEGLMAFYLRKKGWGMIDTAGKYVIPARYRSLSDFKEGFAVAKDHNGFYTFITKKGENAFATKFEDALPFEAGRAAVKLNGKWGLINIHGGWVVFPRFDDLSYASEGMYKCFIKDVKGVMTVTGKQLTELEYDEIEPMGDGVIRVVGKGNTGYIKSNGEWLWEPGKSIEQN